MNKRVILTAVLPMIALAVMASAPARADTPCQTHIKQVQAQWDKMPPMNMGVSVDSANAQITEEFRMAKEACQKGNAVDAETHLNLVRRHLGMDEHSAPHDHM